MDAVETDRNHDGGSVTRRGEIVELKRLQVEHSEYLYELSHKRPEFIYWRFSNGLPSPELFVRALSEQVLAQFLVVDRQSCCSELFVLTGPTSIWVSYT